MIIPEYRFLISTTCKWIWERTRLWNISVTSGDYPFGVECKWKKCFSWVNDSSLGENQRSERVEKRYMKTGYNLQRFIVAH